MEESNNEGDLTGKKEGPDPDLHSVLLPINRSSSLWSAQALVQQLSELLSSSARQSALQLITVIN